MLKIKRDTKQQYLEIVELHLVKYIWIISTHLKLWIASARHNFKWVKIQIE